MKLKKLKTSGCPPHEGMPNACHSMHFPCQNTPENFNSDDEYIMPGDWVKVTQRCSSMAYEWDSKKKYFTENCALTMLITQVTLSIDQLFVKKLKTGKLAHESQLKELYNLMGQFLK